MSSVDTAERRSATVEDYVKAIGRVARGPRRTASTTAVAQALGVTPGSVSAMFKRLAQLELVTHVPYHGVTLTAPGERLALRIARRHRLVETFLVEALGMPRDRVHVEADRLEHHVSDELERRIAATLGEPTVDPHGDPIPSARVVELLYFDGCPGHQRLLPTVERLAGDAGADLRLRAVATPEAAEAERFLGSPTVRVDGVDVEPGAGEREDFGLKCRIYRSADGQAGLPPEAWIRAALSAR